MNGEKKKGILQRLRSITISFEENEHVAEDAPCHNPKSRQPTRHLEELNKWL